MPRDLFFDIDEIGTDLFFKNPFKRIPEEFVFLFGIVPVFQKTLKLQMDHRKRRYGDMVGDANLSLLDQDHQQSRRTFSSCIGCLTCRGFDEKGKWEQKTKSVYANDRDGEGR